MSPEMHFTRSGRKSQQGIAGYRPVLRVSTRDLGDASKSAFATTEPAFQSTCGTGFRSVLYHQGQRRRHGAGLSISHEIVVEEHQGEMRVDSREGEYTEVLILIPRATVAE